jgi:hypothetical protein
MVVVFSALVAMLATSSMAAESKQKNLAVVVLPDSKLVPRQLLPVQEAVMSQVFAHSGPGLAWKLIAFSSIESRQAESQMLEEVDRMVAKGKKDYRYLKLADAQKTFQSAAAMLDRLPPAACKRKTIADLYFYWARAKLDSGDEDGAQELLSQVGRFDPTAGPDPAVMPPNLVATFDLALDSVRIKPEASVELDVGPGPGQIFVDCRLQPAKGVIRGRLDERFWVSAKVERRRFSGSFKFLEAPGRQLSIYSPRPDEAVRVESHLKKLAASKVTLASLKTSRNARLDELARLMLADVLLVTEVDKSKGASVARLALYLPGKGVVGEIATVPVGREWRPDTDGLAGVVGKFSEAVKSQVLLARIEVKKKEPKPHSVVTQKAAVEPKPDLKPRPEPKPQPVGATPPPERVSRVDQPTPWYATWWFWTGAGAVVAGGVLTGILLSMDSGTEPSGKVVISIGSP